MLVKRVAVCALGGAVLAVARLYQQTDSFKDLARRLADAERDDGREWNPTLDVSPEQYIAATASVGGVLGACFPIASTVSGRTGILAGGVFGVALWGAAELVLFRVAPRRTRQWRRDRREVVPELVTYGALVALIDAYALGEPRRRRG